MFKAIVLGSAVALSSVGAMLLPGQFNPIGTAEAAVSVSISFGTFYDDLQPHGSWLTYDGDYVFVPARIGSGWRPYSVGHWVYTDRYGWLWVSDEPFGWATHHYGRWGFDNDIGWYWVPGTRWAPAWVYWRRGGDHTAWAPLPPRRTRGDVDFNIDIGVNDIPDYSWSAVPTRSFLSINLSNVIVRDDFERRRIIRRADPRGTVRINNNIVINNVINVGDIERETRQKVRRVRVVESDRPQTLAKRNNDQIEVYSKPVRAEKSSKPRKVTEAEEVRRQWKAKRQKATERVDSEAGSNQPDIVVVPKKRVQQGNVSNGEVNVVTPTSKQKVDTRIDAKQKVKKREANKQKVRDRKVTKRVKAPDVKKTKQREKAQRLRREQVKQKVLTEQTQNNAKKKKVKKCDPRVSECPPRQP